VTSSIRVALLLVAVTTTALGGLCGSAAAVNIQVTGPEEVVFDYTTDACDVIDIPDGQAQAIRDSLGRVLLYGPGGGGRRMVGPDFNNLTRDCAMRFPLAYDPNPAHYNWINVLVGLYTETGRDIHALVHTEWHGWEIPGACPAGPGQRRCGAGGITYAVSHDNGDTWAVPAPPDNLVATVPPRPTIDDSRAGLFSPTNPIKKGNYYYSVLLLGGIGDQDRGACIMRTPDVGDPEAWRGWDGATFGVKFRNNFYEYVDPQRTHTCEVISPDQIQSMTRSVTYNTALGKYVLTGHAAKFDPAQGRNVPGLFLSTSDDLIHWSMRELIVEKPSLVTHTCGGEDPASYPSLIDHDSTDPNFRITDSDMYLYYTVFHYNAACQLQLDRDLVRLPVRITP
jgi:hypothetical protein